MGADVRYLYSNNNKSTRALVEHNVSEANQSTSNAKRYWKGVATDYIETWSVNAGLNTSGNSDLYGIEGTSSKQLTFENVIMLETPISVRDDKGRKNIDIYGGNGASGYYASKGRDIDIVHLNGSIEIAPILGLTDDTISSFTSLHTITATVTQKCSGIR